jgi:hypothetical protein
MTDFSSSPRLDFYLERTLRYSATALQGFGTSEILGKNSKIWLFRKKYTSSLSSGSLEKGNSSMKRMIIEGLDY